MIEKHKKKVETPQRNELESAAIMGGGGKGEGEGRFGGKYQGEGVGEGGSGRGRRNKATFRWRAVGQGRLWLTYHFVRREKKRLMEMQEERRDNYRKN